VILSDIQAVASRSQYLLRMTLDVLYPPYNNWSTVGGQCASDLAQQMTYWFTWPRVAFYIEQPIGFFIPCDLCDLQTLLYLMYQDTGWCRPNVWDPSSDLAVDPPVVCVAPNMVLEADIKPVATPTFGANYPSSLVATEAGQPIICDNAAPLPCYRDWVALGLGKPPYPAVDPWANIPNPWQGVAPG